MEECTCESIYMHTFPRTFGRSFRPAYPGMKLLPIIACDRKTERKREEERGGERGRERKREGEGEEVNWNVKEIICCQKGRNLATPLLPKYETSQKNRIT